MSSVLTSDVAGDLHHVAYAVACDVSFDSNSGVQMACTGPEYSALHLQVLFLLVHWQCPPASAPTATRFNSYARPHHPAQACWPTSTASRPALAFFLGSLGCNPARHAENCGMPCRCAAAHLCCAAAATAAQQAAGAPGKVCCIAAVHAMMDIMMLRISCQR